MAIRQIVPSKLGHDQVFASRYDSVMKLAVIITRGDRGLAHDLVQDAYVQFVSARPELDTIRNLDGYFYGVLRNLYVSHARRAARAPITGLSAVEYDSIDIGLRNADSQDQARLREELWVICDYACSRKNTSRSSSILILRFFHGYYPAEIAKIAGNSKAAISESIRTAREEIQQHLKECKAKTFLRAPRLNVLPTAGFAVNALQSHRELQRAIFSRRDGECIDPDEVSAIYAQPNGEPVSKDVLAHMVTCRICLDSINRRFGLPLLEERNAIDMTQRDDEFRDGPNGNGTFAGGSTALAGARRKLKQLFEHRPRQLFISINGRYRASHAVSGVLNEIGLSLGSDERVEFVEVVSEQGIRVLCLSADDASEGTTDSVSQKICLSDGRLLEASLVTRSSAQMLRVFYRDPGFLAQKSTVVEAESQRASQDEKRLILTPPSSPRRLLRISWALGLATAFAVVVMLLWRPVSSRSAAALLLQARQAEQNVAEAALHRTVEVEERAAGGRVLRRQRIEIWQSGKMGRVARRVYEKGNNFVIGEWTVADGAMRVQDKQGNSSVEPANSSPKTDFADAWRFDPSAEQFSRWTDPRKAGVTNAKDGFVISYEADGNQPRGTGLLRAELRLKRRTLRATQATLVIREGEETHEFSYLESRYEPKPLADVDPSVFIPERNLEGSSGRSSSSDVRLGHKHPILNPALEVEALYLLSQANADMGEQVEVKRLHNGELSVEGLVDTRERKRQILSVLRPILNNPTIHANIRSVQDIEARRDSLHWKEQAPALVDSYEFENGHPALDSEIRLYLQRQGVAPEAMEADAREYAAGIIHSSMAVLLRARALRAITSRFQPEELAALAPVSKEKWIALVQRHAESMHGEAVLLENKIAPVFYSDDEAGDNRSSYPSNVVELAETSQRLSNIWTGCDRELSAALTLSPDDQRARAVNWTRIRASLSEISTASLAIQQVTERLRTGSGLN